MSIPYSTMYLVVSRVSLLQLHVLVNELCLLLVVQCVSL